MQSLHGGSSRGDSESPTDRRSRLGSRDSLSDVDDMDGSLTDLSYRDRRSFRRNYESDYAEQGFAYPSDPRDYHRSSSRRRDRRDRSYDRRGREFEREGVSSQYIQLAH